MMNGRSILWIGPLLLGLTLSAGNSEALSDLNDNGDFALIATDGFTRTVDGAYFADPARTQFPNLVPNPDGSMHNVHSWSVAWFQDALWMGTSKYALRGEEAGGQIWRYRPSRADESGDWGLSGRWELVWASPPVGPLLTALKLRSIGLVRDVGYRTMSICDAGDRIPRLYVASFGLPGLILYYDPGRKTFRKTSSKGLFTTLPYVIDGTFSFSHRALTCYKGRLWASPAGELKDTDTTSHPVLLMNPDPAGGASWQRMVDLSDPASHPLADPGNIGVFQAEVVGDYLYLSVVNRTTGLELWRGDGRDCPPPWEDKRTCEIRWTKIIDNGGGRPSDLQGNPIDNAGATLGVIGNDLYIGAGDSAVEGYVRAELFRVPNAGTQPSADPSAPHTWELLAGWPRRNYAKPAERQPGLENLECHNTGDMADTSPPFWTEPQIQLDDDDLPDDCLPTSNMGPGINLDLPEPEWSGLKLGPVSYLWRFAKHQGEVFVGTTNHYRDEVDVGQKGFSLLKSADGTRWTAVTSDGLGDPENWGLRSILSVPDLGLVVGTTNTTGNQVFIGTTTPPGNLVPPVPQGGGNQLIYDWDKTGAVDALLDASRSTDPFGGGGITSYEWFAGSLEELGAGCAGLDAGQAFSTQVKAELQDLASKTADQMAIDHWYTLRVTDVDGLVNCREVRITASYDLPPSVEVTTSVPYGPPDADGMTSLPQVKMIDFNADGAESYDMSGVCRDDFAKLVRCELVVASPRRTRLSEVVDTRTRPGLCNDLQACPVSASVSASLTSSSFVRLAAAKASPDVYLVAEDEAGHEARFSLINVTQQIVDRDGNDPPVCRNADVFLMTKVDTHAVVDPATGDQPICVDPDGDPLTYADGGLDPASGVVAFDGAIVYTPDDPTRPGIDQLEFLARDPVPEASSPTTLRINFVDDTTGPQVVVEFPVQGASYLLPGLKAGCATLAGDLCGRASDAQSEVTAVEVRIQRLPDGAWWDGRHFVEGEPVWLPASGTGSWRLDSFLPIIGGDFRVQARARDSFGNLGVSEPVDFRVAVGLLQKLLSDRLFGG